jgi:hypothetical protein
MDRNRTCAAPDAAHRGRNRCRRREVPDGTRTAAGRRCAGSGTCAPERDHGGDSGQRRLGRGPGAVTAAGHGRHAPPAAAAVRGRRRRTADRLRERLEPVAHARTTAHSRCCNPQCDRRIARQADAPVHHRSARPLCAGGGIWYGARLLGSGRSARAEPGNSATPARGGSGRRRIRVRWRARARLHDCRRARSRTARDACRAHGDAARRRGHRHGCAPAPWHATHIARRGDRAHRDTPLCSDLAGAQLHDDPGDGSGLQAGAHHHVRRVASTASLCRSPERVRATSEIIESVQNAAVYNMSRPRTTCRSVAAS